MAKLTPHELFNFWQGEARENVSNRLAHPEQYARSASIRANAVPSERQGGPSQLHCVRACQASPDLRYTHRPQGVAHYATPPTRIAEFHIR